MNFRIVKFLFPLSVIFVGIESKFLNASNYRKIVFPDKKTLFSFNSNETKKSEILFPSEDFSSFSNDNENEQPRLENRKYFQGDIVLSTEQQKSLTESKTNESIASRTGITLDDYHWPKAELGEVVIPYSVERSSEFSKFLKFLC